MSKYKHYNPCTISVSILINTFINHTFSFLYFHNKSPCLQRWCLITTSMSQYIIPCTILMCTLVGLIFSLIFSPCTDSLRVITNTVINHCINQITPSYTLSSFEVGSIGHVTFTDKSEALFPLLHCFFKFVHNITVLCSNVFPPRPLHQV